MFFPFFEFGRRREHPEASGEAKFGWFQEPEGSQSRRSSVLGHRIRVFRSPVFSFVVGGFFWCLWWVWGKRAQVSLDFSEWGKAWAEAVIGVVVPASALFEGSTG